MSQVTRGAMRALIRIAMGPHWLKAEGPEHGVYVRLGSTNRQADQALIDELRRTAEGVAFDELPMPDLGVEDLDLVSAQKLFL